MSSLKDLASLIMIPSLYKDGELHTVKPLADENIIVHPDATDNNDGVDGTTPSTSSNFTFSRGSNLAATRVDVNGLIEKGRENLLLQSNQFDTTWYNINSTETSGQLGYDGSNNAWKLTKTSSGAYLRQNLSASNVLNFSIYAKSSTDAGDSQGIWLLINGNPDAWGKFNLSNGTFTLGTGATISAAIVSVGNGWYRCSVQTDGGAQDVRLYPSNASGDYSGTSGSIYIQDAQLEQGLVATDYIETTTTSVSAGILEDMPRLDYSGSCPSLLLEPQRTNIIGQSEYFGDWALSRTSAFGSGSVLNETTSPEGVVNAAYIQQASGQTSGGGVYGGYSYTSGTTYTLSVFAKKKENRYARIGFGIGQSGGAIFCGFDLQDGVAGAPNTGITPKIEDYGNGWYRCSITATAQTSGARNTFLYQSSNLDDFTTIPLNGIYIYGAQLEQASYPTSYIPTYGTSQTRSGDAVSITDIQTNGLIGSNQGSFVFHYKPYNAYTGGGGEIYDFRIDSNNRMATYFSNGTLRLFSNIAGATNFNQGTTLDGDTEFKIGVAYDADSTLVYINGTLTYTLNGFDLGVTDFDILPPTNGSKVADFSWFPTKLTATELASLTTI